MPSHFSDFLAKKLAENPTKFSRALRFAIQSSRSEHRGWFGGSDLFTGKITKQEHIGQQVINELATLSGSSPTVIRQACIAAVRKLFGSDTPGGWNIGTGSIIGHSTSYKPIVMANFLTQLKADKDVAIKYEYVLPGAKSSDIQLAIRSNAENAFRELDARLPKHSPTPVYQQFTDMALDSATAEPHEELPQPDSIEPK
ncbi:hypothetical protein AVI51_04325 [Piscirickettsia salmonis]|uniref:Uncharacterized protein n=1 Tax=Piscirickettsia salmonis TaxID=1238 RepID=A0A9Q5YM30_PISSA|nr:hypothetical protein [Piscirickettsia salmonis]ALA25334.1 phosphoglucomutase [Piscirickettsia salmonis]APS45569.1 hypothetical protein AVI48_15080 [Piscirickettsia salmonis]APS46225.1 hypothetical protein AVI49_00300 [Piscirickettsia salmonis]APS50156.1 hypothetical protein AVI50_04365 [Piscirickettsia salmonis]APS53357.1 hypothetical protein AVI51_04325 [Piscirickettsia salmonis]